jgi:alpha-L-fucosidase
MWNSTSISTTWNWNAVDIGPRRDLLGELSMEVQATTSPHTGKPIQFGVYHSLYEWFNPLYQIDKKSNYTKNEFVRTKTLPELYDLVKRYRPTLIWSDGEWEAPSWYWNSTKFLQWYATESPVADQAVWNDRWGRGTLCKHGGFLTCTDRYSPGKIQTKKWEDAFTIDKTSWGLNRNATYSDYMTVKEIVDLLIETVAYNGNVLLNVGPAADGTIHPIFVDRLLGIGEHIQALLMNRMCVFCDSQLICWLWCCVFRKVAENKWPSHLRHETLAGVSKRNGFVGCLLHAYA